jgi:uncharacterized OB-fold protein
MQKSSFSAIHNYRKHNKITALLEKTGAIVAYTKIENPFKSQFYSGVVALIKLDIGLEITVAIHSEDCKNLNIGAKVKTGLRLEGINTEGLRNYGLVAKLI